MRSRLVVLALALSALVLPARAAELVMFEEAGCPWCLRWHAEVGEGYALSDEGRRAPLRMVDIHDKRPDDLAFIKSVVATPTFVLVDGGKEIGRITGYPGADFFWSLVTQMVAKLPAQAGAVTATRCPDAAHRVSRSGASC